jgi:hypothetical protein
MARAGGGGVEVVRLCSSGNVFNQKMEAKLAF